MRVSWSVVALILGAIGISTALIIGVANAPQGLNSASTPLVTTIIGVVSALVPTIVASLKSEQAHKAAKQAQSDTAEIKNGLMTDKMKDALHEVASEPDSNVIIVPNIEKAKEDPPHG